MAEGIQGQNPNGHVAIEVLDAAWVSSITQRLPAMADSTLSNKLPTIYKVPISIRQADNSAYEPQLVSIGPYHHNKKKLKPMEKHKWRYLQTILSRNRAVSLEDYLQDIKALVAQARRSYSESIKLDRNQFVEMMLLDGCFVVELFIKRFEKDARDDPINGNPSLMQFVSEDLLLLENQLPYFVLQCVFKLVLPNGPVDTLPELAIKFFYFAPFDTKVSNLKSCHHLLHLIHHHCLPINPMREKLVKDLKFSIPSAQKLHESGIKFIKRKEKGSLLDVRFQNGVMEIPPLFVDDFPNSLFRNLIAYEQSYPAGCYFIIYTTFLDLIVNTRADVEILRDKGILEHGLGSDKEVAILFNQMGKGVIVDYEETHLSNLLKNVTEYCDGYWHRWRATLVHDYFSSPWSILSLIGATVLLASTVLGAFYTTYTYYHPPS